MRHLFPWVLMFGAGCKNNGLRDDGRTGSGSMNRHWLIYVKLVKRQLG